MGNTDIRDRNMDVSSNEAGDSVVVSLNEASDSVVVSSNEAGTSAVHGKGNTFSQ